MKGELQSKVKQARISFAIILIDIDYLAWMWGQSKRVTSNLDFFFPPFIKSLVALAERPGAWVTFVVKFAVGEKRGQESKTNKRVLYYRKSENLPVHGRGSPADCLAACLSSGESEARLACCGLLPHRCSPCVLLLPHSSSPEQSSRTLPLKRAHF